MRRGRAFALLLGSVVSSAAFAQTGVPAVSRAQSSPTRWHSGDAIIGAAHGGDRLQLDVLAVADDLEVALDLQRRDVFAPNAQLIVETDSGPQLLRPGVQIYAGAVAGHDGSLAFVAVTDDGAQGFISIGPRTFLISSGPALAGGETLITETNQFPEEMFRIDEFECRTLISPRAAKKQDAPRGGSGLRSEPCRLADVAVETDREFTLNLFGGNTTAAANYATTLIAAVSEIYKRDFNLALQITFLRVWSTSDPWNGGDTYDQLIQFQNNWNVNMTGVSRHMAHFLSGRSLGGGIAYLPGMCQDDFDYGLSADLDGFFPYPLVNNNSANWDIVVTAHEMGHNVGAPHTHEVSPPIDCCGGNYGGTCGGVKNCSSANQGTIMSYCHTCSGGISNMRLEFHTRTINESVLPYLNSGAPCGLVAPALSIGDQPDPAMACAGSPASFQVVASGAGMLKYQWRRNGVNVGGATSATYNIASVNAGHAGTYDCLVKDACGQLVSDGALLTVDNGPSINDQPDSADLCEGDPLSLSISASGADAYQWKKNGDELPGETGPSLSIAAASAGDAGTYTCVISNACGPLSSAGAVINVGVAAAVSDGPDSQNAMAGTTVVFSAAATGSPAPAYQWLFNGDDLSGETGSTLTLFNVNASDEGSYQVRVSNACGTATSDPADLTIDGSPCPGDANGDLVVENADLQKLLDAWGTELGDAAYDPAADFNQDGQIENADLQTLIDNWSADCN